LERQLSSLDVIFSLISQLNTLYFFSTKHAIRPPRDQEMKNEEKFEHILTEIKNVPGSLETRGQVRQRKDPMWTDDGEIMLTQGFSVTYLDTFAHI
jgi:hypothetical protein